MEKQVSLQTENRRPPAHSSSADKAITALGGGIMGSGLGGGIIGVIIGGLVGFGIGVLVENNAKEQHSKGN